MQMPTYEREMVSFPVSAQAPVESNRIRLRPNIYHDGSIYPSPSDLSIGIHAVPFNRTSWLIGIHGFTIKLENISDSNDTGSIALNRVEMTAVALETKNVNVEG